MFDDFLIRAGLAGLAVAIAAGPLGCFVVWRKMAYFGDATAHAAIFGVAISFAFSISVYGGVLIAALLMAGIVSTMSGRLFALDTLLGVAAHAALAIGLVAVALTGSANLNLESYLFGEILAVSKFDLAIIWLGAIVIVALLIARWSALLMSTLNSDLAYASGIRPRREQALLTLALTILVAVAIKVVGALLITAMLIIPAAAARPMTRTPEAMALVAMLCGVVSTLAGLATSFKLDTPTGPTIVSVAALVFAVTATLSWIHSRFKRST